MDCMLKTFTEMWSQDLNWKYSGI